jgi:hypothetical protein
MNLRILKKLSKRALPYLAHNPHQWGKPFLAEKGDNYTGVRITAHNDMERSLSMRGDPFGEGAVAYKPRRQEGRQYPYVVLRPARHPKKGTPMFGWMDGGEQPEWDETTAWETFQDWVVGNYSEFETNTANLVLTRRLKTPSDFFRAADELLTQAA